jgi:hypothetical protein
MRFHDKRLHQGDRLRLILSRIFTKHVQDKKFRETSRIVHQGGNKEALLLDRFRHADGVDEVVQMGRKKPTEKIHWSSACPLVSIPTIHILSDLQAAIAEIHRMRLCEKQISWHCCKSFINEQFSL